MVSQFIRPLCLLTTGIISLSVLFRETFNQGRRRYYVDLRQNDRGRFLKVTMLAGSKTFIAIPGDYISTFRDHLVSLLDKFVHEIDDWKKTSESLPPRNNRPPPPPPPQATQVASTDSRELRCDGKRFYFDVDHNDRGTFIKLSEVSAVIHSGMTQCTHVKSFVGCAHTHTLRAS